MVDFTEKSSYGIQDLLDIVAILRSEDGCPWDRAQTHASIRKNFIEETYEAVDAIDQQDAKLLCEELGDVMLQVALHCQMEAEQGTFTFEDVCDGICKKLIYRHPHVFGDSELKSTGEVSKAWEMLKNKAKGRTTAQADLESVPGCLPALMRAGKVQKRAAGYGIAYPDLAAAVRDLDEEVAELKQAAATGVNLAGEVGDVLFSTTNLARMCQVDAEEALTGTTNRFAKRVTVCEQLAKAQGRDLKSLSGEELDTLWEQAKQQLQATGE